VKIISNDNDKCEFLLMVESLQPTITQAFDNIKKYAFNHPKQKKLNNNIAAFIVEDLQLFAVLRSQAFKRVIERLDIQANIPSIDHLKEIFINSEDKILKKIREYAINNTEISSISFTTDMWTLDNGDPYIELMLHWINSNFQIKEIIGNISYLPYPHTAKCLFNKIIEILDNLQLKNVTVCGTIDNGSNIKSCLEKLERKYELSLNDWDKITKLVKLLYLYEVISKKLSGSQYLTLSQAWFVINFIKVKFDCAITNYTDIQNFRNFLYESIQTRFLEPTKPIRLAAFFDPRTKDMQIFIKENKKLTISEALTEYELTCDSFETNTLSNANNKDIFASTTTNFQENPGQQYSTSCEFNSYLLVPKASSETDIL
ncbi:17865_t:CDS:2, partial [Racocetra fulgida]